MTLTWPAKDPEERFAVAFDFSAELPLGVTLDAVPVTVSVTLRAGVDAAPGDVLNGPFAAAAGVVQQPVRGGVDGANYYLKAVAQISTTLRLVRAAVLPVRNA